MGVRSVSDPARFPGSIPGIFRAGSEHDPVTRLPPGHNPIARWNARTHDYSNMFRSVVIRYHMLPVVSESTVNAINKPRAGLRGPVISPDPGEDLCPVAPDIAVRRMMYLSLLAATEAFQ